MAVTSIPILRLLVVVAVFWNRAIASPTQPQDAEITPMAKLDVRQDLAYNDPRFVGWEAHGGSVYQRTCNFGYTYSVSNRHFQCCTTSGSCYFATGCAGLYTALFTDAPSSSVSCLSSGVCVTGNLYWSTEDTAPYTFIGCGSSNYWVVQSTDSSGLLSWTPGAAAVTNPTTQKGSTISTTSPPPTTTPPTTAPATVTTTPVPTAPSPAAATSPSSGGGGGSSNNGAIIGGAVGGGAVAIGLIVLGILLFLRRKRNHAPAQPVAGPQQPYPNQPGQPQQDMRPMSYVPPGSPPPPWDGAYSQQHSMMAGKAPAQYQYETVAKEDPHLQPQQYSPQVPQAVEMQGTPATHPMELQGTQR